MGGAEPEVQQKMLLGSKERERIAEVLKEKGALLPCPRCGRKHFSILEGYFVHPISKTYQQGLMLGGPSIPVAVVVCSHCGFLSEHALGALDLLNRKDDK